MIHKSSFSDGFRVGERNGPFTSHPNSTTSRTLVLVRVGHVSRSTDSSRLRDCLVGRCGCLKAMGSEGSLVVKKGRHLEAIESLLWLLRVARHDGFSDAAGRS